MRDTLFDFFALCGGDMSVLYTDSSHLHHSKIFAINPMGKPRITHQGRFTDRAKKYYKYKEDLLIQRGSFVMPESNLYIIFYIPFPRSWNAKQKEQMYLKPHQQKPDLDNLVKALFDTFLTEDKKIWEFRAVKVWNYEGSISIFWR